MLIRQYIKCELEIHLEHHEHGSKTNVPDQQNRMRSHFNHKDSLQYILGREEEHSQLCAAPKSFNIHCWSFKSCSEVAPCLLSQNILRHKFQIHQELTEFMKMSVLNLFVKGKKHLNFGYLPFLTLFFIFRYKFEFESKIWIPKCFSFPMRDNSNH
jgi:hypothetical protein